MRMFKNTLLLLLPIVLIFALIIPYAILLDGVIVDWLGCGCPRVDAQGNSYYAAFNANDFTEVFWYGLSGVAALLGFWFSGKVIPRKWLWLRILYLVILVAIALAVAVNMMAISKLD